MSGHGPQWLRRLSGSAAQRLGGRGSAVRGVGARRSAWVALVSGVTVGGAATQEGLTTPVGVRPGADQGVNRHSSG